VFLSAQGPSLTIPAFDAFQFPSLTPLNSTPTIARMQRPRGYLLMTRELLDAGAELLPDEKGRTPLHLAAANDDEPLVKLLLKRAKRKWDAKTAFTTGGYSRPAAPVHLCKKPNLRKLLEFRGCGDDDGGQTRIKVEGDGRGVEITTSMKIAAGVAAFVVALYVRARRQIEEGYARPTKYVR
jgi:ankyrin repeat protein